MVASEKCPAISLLSHRQLMDWPPRLARSTNMTTQAAVGVCDLCGGDHPAGSCIQTSHLDLQNKVVRQHEPHLAYQSLPSWVEMQEGPGRAQVVVRQQVPRLVRLGPLVAPHTPYLPQNTVFPLKICHEGGSHTFLDLSRKWLCNWLSLIPVGSPTKYNLVACQIDDLIYYVSMEDISAGSSLVVWYAPFYQPKVQKELQEIGSPHSLVGAMVVTQKVGRSLQPSAKKPLVVAPSLSRIVVGQGEVTFTHHSVQQGDADGHRPRHLIYLNNKCGNGILPLGDQVPEATSTLVTQGITQTKKYMLEGKNTELYSGQPLQANLRPSIQLVPDSEDLAGPEYMVRLTVTAAQEATYDQELLDQDGADVHNLVISSVAEGKTATQTSPVSYQRRKYRQLNGHKSGVGLAGSDKVKQLPPRALGARDSRPWTCCYCSQQHSCLLTFTRHLKAHLLWLVGRIHVCHTCGTSLSSTKLLQRHQQEEHPKTDSVVAVPNTAEDEDATKSVLRKSLESNVINEEQTVDNPDQEDKFNSLKRIAALPTKLTEGPHTCQICTKSFHKPHYLLRHLRKHSGDFTCQSCLKVFARKENLLKHMCPNGGEATALPCLVCGRSFLNSRLLQQHHLRHQGAKKCVRCGWLVTSQVALKRHMSSCPSVQVTKCYQCEVCGKQLGTVKQLEAHQALHRQQHNCPLCSKRYISSTYLARHVPLCRQSHQLSSLGQVTCEDCGKEFTDATAFRIHYHTHTHPFNCSRCNHRFQTRVGFEVHVCEMEQQCDQCGTTFRSLQALNRHAAVHGPPPFSCKSCRRSYYRKESLDRHTCNFEADGEPAQPKEEIIHTCNECGTQVTTRRSLNTHMRSAHGHLNGRSQSCETCGKRFCRRDLLRQHQAVHAPPSLPCPTCHKLFKTPKSLEVHSLIHLNIKPFTCKYCNKKFHQKVNLVRHERSHLPRGIVKCQYCTTHCSSTDELKAHLLSHTLSQEEQEDLPESSPPLTLVKKEEHEDEEEHREVLLPQFAPHRVVEPQLKFVPEDKSTLGTNQPLCGTGHILTANPRLDENGEGLKLIVKEEAASRLKTDVNKDCSSLLPGLRTKLVHSVVPVMASELTFQAAAVSHHDIAGQSTVFLPHRISNFSLTAAETPLPSEYLVPATPGAAASSSHHIGNSSVFKVTNDSLTTDGCRLPSNVLITSTTVPALDGAENCHLVTSKECHEASEIVQEVPVPSSNHGSKVRHLALSSDPACLYQPASVSATQGTERAQVHDCHVLREQIVQSVVLVAEPPVTDC